MDRGALDAALEAGFPCGGWCPEGRTAEDGAIADRYPVVELPGGGYLERTRQNVIDSDGTLVIVFGQLSGGTQETLRYCEELGKPVLVCDAEGKAPAAIAKSVLAFARKHGIARLNVAGPRESKRPGARAFTAGVIASVIRNAAGQG